MCPFWCFLISFWRDSLTWNTLASTKGKLHVTHGYLRLKNLILNLPMGLQLLCHYMYLQILMNLDNGEWRYGLQLTMVQKKGLVSAVNNLLFQIKTESLVGGPQSQSAPLYVFCKHKKISIQIQATWIKVCHIILYSADASPGFQFNYSIINLNSSKTLMTVFG